MGSPLGTDDLVLSHFTLGRAYPIEGRIEAAVAGGYSAIGLYVREVERVDLGRLGDLLDEARLQLSDLEVVAGWGSGPAALEHHAFALADRFGGRCLQAVGPYDGTIDDAGRSFGRLCDRAADHGLVVALEPLPFTNIPDIATALEVVERAGRPNGGLCVDIWHHTRVGEDRAVLRALPPERIHCVQISDGPLAPPTPDLADYKDDCLRHRVPPGEGEMDAVGVVAALLDAGATVPWSVEVCSESVTEANGVEHARRCADGTRSVLAAARSTVPGSR